MKQNFWPIFSARNTLNLHSKLFPETGARNWTRDVRLFDPLVGEVNNL